MIDVVTIEIYQIQKYLKNISRVNFILFIYIILKHTTGDIFGAKKIKKHYKLKTIHQYVLLTQI